MNNQEFIEKNVLGHLIAFGRSGETDQVFEILTAIEPDYFEEEKHRILYTEIINVFVKRKKLDTLTLFTELSKNNKLELCGGIDYLNNLYSKREYTTDVFQAVHQLGQLKKKKELIQYCNDALTKIPTADSVESVADELDKKIYSLRESKKDTIVDVVKEANIVIDKANNAEKYGCYGYSWGIGNLDFHTGGIELGKTYVVGATKKSGKTKFIINTIHSLKAQRVKSLFLSLEMGGESVVKELLSRFALVNNNELKRPLSVETETLLKNTIGEISDGIIIDTQSFLNLMQIRHKIRMASRQECKVVFIDYLQRMDFQLKGNTLNYATVISQTVSQIADIAKEFNVAIVFLSQLANRAENEQATIADLKDSGGIGEGVDCILILNNQDRIEKNYTNKTNEIWITIEQRSGASGQAKCIVDLSIARYLPKDDERN